MKSSVSAIVVVITIMLVYDSAARVFCPCSSRCNSIVVANIRGNAKSPPPSMPVFIFCFFMLVLVLFFVSFVGSFVVCVCSIIFPLSS